MTARKIPSSAMLFLRRPAWGWHQVLRSNRGSLAAFAAMSLAGRAAKPLRAWRRDAPSNRQIGDVPQADDPVFAGGQNAHIVRGECDPPYIARVMQGLAVLPGM